MTQKAKSMEIFINPSGFVEQHYSGTLEPEAILEGLIKLKKYSKELESQNKPVLILEDVSKIKKLEFLSPRMAKVRKAAAKTTKEINFTRAAVYGPLHIQIIITTLALVAGKRDILQAFDNRVLAIKWLLGKK
jgi:hypothetical protein